MVSAHPYDDRMGFRQQLVIRISKQMGDLTSCIEVIGLILQLKKNTISGEVRYCFFI